MPKLCGKWMLFLLFFSLVLRKIVFMACWKNARVELRYSEWDLLLLYTTVRYSAASRRCPLTPHAMFLTITTYQLTKPGQRASKGENICIKDGLNSLNTVDYVPCSWTLVIGQFYVTIYKNFLEFLLSQMNNPFTCSEFMSIGSYMIETQIRCFPHTSYFHKQHSSSLCGSWILFYSLWCFHRYWIRNVMLCILLKT